MPERSDLPEVGRPGHRRIGALSVQKHTDWRCTTWSWQRGRWRPTMSLRFGRATPSAFGFFVGRDEEGLWELTAAGVFFDVLGSISGPWEDA